MSGGVDSLLTISNDVFWGDVRRSTVKLVVCRCHRDLLILAPFVKRKCLYRRIRLKKGLGWQSNVERKVAFARLQLRRDMT